MNHRITHCPNCGGHGLVGHIPPPATRTECGGSGTLVVYRNDALAQYPGGPMLGSWPGRYEEVGA